MLQMAVYFSYMADVSIHVFVFGGFSEADVQMVWRVRLETEPGSGLWLSPSLLFSSLLMDFIQRSGDLGMSQRCLNTHLGFLEYSCASYRRFRLCKEIERNKNAPLCYICVVKKVASLLAIYFYA